MNDIQKFSCPIMWSTKLKPEDIERVLMEERIQKFLERGMLPVALFPFDVKKFMDRYGVIDPSLPMGWICSIYIEDSKYMAQIVVPEPYVPHYKCICDPVVHPIMMGKPGHPEGWRITSMHVYERNQLNKRNIYDGVNYPEEAQIGPEIGIPDLMSALTQAREKRKLSKNHLIKWDELERDDVSSINNIDEGGPTMDYRIQSYDDYGAHGPIEPVVLVEGESKPGRHNKKYPDFPLKAKRYLVGFDENGNDIWQDIKRDNEEENNNE